MIRPARPGDYDRLVNLWLESLGNTQPRLSDSYLSSVIDEMRQVRLPRSETFVIEADDRILGFISILDGYVLSFHVAPAFRSRGLGRQLLDHMKAKHEALTLDVLSGNKQAISFYVREGFAPTGRRMHESGHEVTSMEWKRQSA